MAGLPHPEPPGRALQSPVPGGSDIVPAMSGDQAIRALLEWYTLAGVDQAIDHAPRDRYREAADARAAAAEPSGQLLGPPRTHRGIPAASRRARTFAAARVDAPAGRCHLERAGDCRRLHQPRPASGSRARLRWLRAQAHRHQHRDRRWQSGGQTDDRGRGAGRRGGSPGPPLRRSRRAAAGPDARRHRPRPLFRLHHQHASLAAARQPLADRRGARHLPALLGGARSS